MRKVILQGTVLPRFRTPADEEVVETVITVDKLDTLQENARTSVLAVAISVDAEAVVQVKVSATSAVALGILLANVLRIVVWEVVVIRSVITAADSDIFHAIVQILVPISRNGVTIANK